MTSFLLWADFETTGLEPRMDTILEAAWTITSDQLEMLTPLRSRLCLIDPPNRRRDSAHIAHPLGNISRFGVGDRNDAIEGDWGALSEVVQDMHDKSGLRGLLEFATSDPVESLRLLTTGNDLGRLIREDLYTVGYNRFDDSLILAGAGVSHFDNRVFAHHLPDMFPLGGNGRTGYAYWQHDVSVAARVLGEAWTGLYNSALTLPPDHPIYRGLGISLFDPTTLVCHRAADDVIRALIDGRILRMATGWSVK